jgi:hypothetical protein
MKNERKKREGEKNYTDVKNERIKDRDTKKKLKVGKDRTNNNVGRIRYALVW